MPATGSTRTATPWSWCSRAWAALRRRRAVDRAPRVRALRGLAAGAALLSAGCVTTTTTAYLPTPGQPRLTLDDARDEMDALLRAECPRLLQAGKPTQEARLTVDVDSAGNVARAQLTGSSGDEQMDRIFGGVAARLHFQAPAPAEMKGATVPGHMRIGYSCSEKTAVATIQLL